MALRACLARGSGRRARFLLVGDRGVVRDSARRLRLGAAPLSELPLEEIAELAASDRRPGRPSAAGAEAAYRSILRATELVREGRADAIVTAPVSKHAIQSLGYEFPGHTELIARLAGEAEVRMMMAAKSLRVVLVTTHIRLLDVPSAVTTERVIETARIARAALRRHFGMRRPRIALAGLNPHAGEHGAFGDEEIRVLAPAVERSRAQGITLDGPHPPDTVFFRARAGEFDAVISLYHDQGLIPFKLLHFHDGVNVTIGLPFPRTSPDHGTAYDIAGRSRADASSMTAAVRLAAEMCSARPPER